MIYYIGNVFVRKWVLKTSKLLTVHVWLCIITITCLVLF